ncbi:SsgA family sporulation/cell division regulator [Streptomyces sp. Y1]|uniref:SsgA family sporulation/cell division regulator n=1 Tax=Streptomyces sp. Y1 TaxID=3238634 RepID=A0AB39TKZ8_9ACTN
MQHSTTVQEHLVMGLALSPELALGLVVELAYDPGDPYAVRFTFHLPGDPPVTWVFARELLLDGLGGPAGEGDVLIEPVEEERSPEVRVTLRSPGGEAVLRARVAPLLAFLARTDRLVPIGRESTGRQLDAELADILGGPGHPG